MTAQTAATRTKRELQNMAERKPPWKGAIWFGPEYGWGVKPSKVRAAQFAAATKALAGIPRVKVAV